MIFDLLIFDLLLTFDLLTSDLLGGLWIILTEDIRTVDWQCSVAICGVGPSECLRRHGAEHTRKRPSGNLKPRRIPNRRQTQLNHRARVRAAPPPSRGASLGVEIMELEWHSLGVERAESNSENDLPQNKFVEEAEVMELHNDV